MLSTVPFVHSLAPAVGLTMFLAANPPAAPVTSDAPAYQALASGDYAQAAEMLASGPESAGDPYVELDLGLAYQGVGRMDLAEPLYRRAIEDGKDTIPAVTTNARDAGKSLGEIACENMRIGFSDPTVC